MAASALGLILSGCAGESASTEPTAGGTLTLYTQAEGFRHLDPQRNHDRVTMALATSFLHRTLTAYAPGTGELVADLATDLGTPNSDFTSWSFTLRPGVSFQTGEGIGCADVAYGVSRTFATDVITGGPAYALDLLDIPLTKKGKPVFKGPYSDKGKDAFAAAVSCSTDNQTITFKLSRSAPDFNFTVALPAFSPVPSVADTGAGYDAAPISSGPYRITKNLPGQVIRLGRNPAWVKESDEVRSAWPNKIEIRFNQDPLETDAAITTGLGSGDQGIGLDRVQPENLAAVFNDPVLESRRLNAASPEVGFYAFDLERLSCLPIRQAIAAGLDRERFQLLNGGADFYGVFADGLISPTALPEGYREVPPVGGMKPAGNPEQALEHLDEAAQACPKLAKAFRKNGFSVNLPKSMESAETTQVWVDSMKAIGIAVEVKYRESDTYFRQVVKDDKRADLTWVSWAPDWPNAASVLPPLLGESPFNFTHQGGKDDYADLVAKLAAAAAMPASDEQTDIWAEINQTAVGQRWVLPMFFFRQQYIWGERLRDVKISPVYGVIDFGRIWIGPPAAATD